MAAKEPTVERRHRDLALKLLYGGPILSELKWAETGIEPEDSHEGIRRAVRVAQALAAAEQAIAERAWDEGRQAQRRYQLDADAAVNADTPQAKPPVNPYRQPKRTDEVNDIRDTQVYREIKRRLDALQEATKLDRPRCIGMLDSEFADHYKAQRAALDALFQEASK